jgi:hypothetical protein
MLDSAQVHGQAAAAACALINLSNYSWAAPQTQPEQFDCLPCPPCLPAAGTLINTAHLAARQPPDSQPAADILTASHCRSYDTADDAASYCSVVFDYELQGCRGGSRRRK